MSKIVDFQNQLNANLTKVSVHLVAGYSYGGEFSDAMDITHLETGDMIAVGETDERLGAFFAHVINGGQMLKFTDRAAALEYFDREADLLAED